MNDNVERLQQIQRRALWAAMGNSAEAKFLAHARDDVRWLLQIIEDQQAELDRLRLLVPYEGDDDLPSSNRIG